MVGLALASGAGATITHLGVPPAWTLPPLLILLLLVRTSPRPISPLPPLALAFASGALLNSSWRERVPGDCRFLLEDGVTVALSGRILGPLVDGRVEILPTAPDPGPCRETLRVVAPGQEESRLEPGALVVVEGVWRATGVPGLQDPLRAGYLRVDSLPPMGRPGKGLGIEGRPDHGRTRLRDLRARIGGRVQSRLAELFPRTSALAVALVWARKDGLTAEIREAFARAGVAHLLAISGFHVGVVGGVLLLVLGQAGLPHAGRYLLASSGVWIYTLTIGMPDAALRAAFLLSVLAAGRVLNRPVASLGALSTTFLALSALDPGALFRPGFQLSFAGTAGLMVGYRPLGRWIAAATRGLAPGYLARGVAAGLAATLATLPIVAWYFGRISLIGIPVTLLVAPLVALAIPGIFFSLLVASLHPELGAFMASGVEVVLQVFRGLVAASARVPFASLWVSKPTVVAAVAFLSAGVGVLAIGWGRGGRRFSFLALAAAAGLILGTPLTLLRQAGTLEIVVLDVGQGDAALLRSPRGRWILVDAGPKTRTFDAGERTVLPYLRERGIRVLDLMVITHSDADHVGGAQAILEGVSVKGVMDPGRPAGSDAYLGALESAAERAVPWGAVEAGDSLDFDGMAVRVLAPESRDEGGGEEANDASVVLEIRFGSFSAILAGDAPSESEARFGPRIISPQAQVLKVGHHGSATSTSAELLSRIRPEVVLISVGRRNRFGHPDSGVLSRLEAGGARVLRTDLDGNVVVRGWRDGGYIVSTEYR